MSAATKQSELNYRVKERVKFREKGAYGLGALADALIWSSVGAFGTFYYTNSAGLAAAAIGTMFLLSRIFDGVSDIIMGLIIDRTNSKFGKARPWLLWMAIPYAFAAVLLFSVPLSFGPLAKLIYVYITYNLVSTITYTAIIQPYSTLSALITDNVKDRTHLNIARMAVAMVGSVLINFIVLPMVKAFGGDHSSWTKTFAVLGGIAAGIFLVCFLNTKERLGSGSQTAGKAERKAEKVPVGIAFKALITNKYWVNRILYGLTITIATATTGVNIYFATYWLNNPGAVGFLSIGYVIPMLISLIILTPLSTRFGKRNTSQLGVCIMIAGLILQMVAPANMAIVIIGYAIRGFGTGLATVISGVLLADTIDYGEWKSGVRTEGLVFSAATMGTKIGSGLGAALLGWLLGWGGFDAQAAIQSSSAMTAILSVFIYVPLGVAILALLLNAFYGLDKKMPQILQDLQERNTVH